MPTLAHLNCLLKLPGCVANSIKALGLEFGAIDLALQDDVYYFLEINPTGEWGWLMGAELPIAEALARVLS